MKNKFLLIIVLCFQTLFLAGQTIICAGHISKENIHREELLTAIKTYENRINPHNSRIPTIYLVDFFQEDGLNKYRIIADRFPCTPLFRQPCCIVRLDSFAIAFLYTPDFRKPKDNLFLDILEREMSSVFNQRMGYNWETLTMEDVAVVATSFSPSVIEYTFRDGKLINTRPYDRMYYEDLHSPLTSFWMRNCREFCPRCRGEADEYQYRLRNDREFARQERIRLESFMRERNEERKLEFPIGTSVRAWVSCPHSSMSIQIVGEIIDWRVTTERERSFLVFSNKREDGSFGPTLRGPEMRLEYLEARIKIAEFTDPQREENLGDAIVSSETTWCGLKQAVSGCTNRLMRTRSLSLSKCRPCPSVNKQSE